MFSFNLISACSIGSNSLTHVRVDTIPEIFDSDSGKQGILSRSSNSDSRNRCNPNPRRLTLARTRRNQDCCLHHFIALHAEDNLFLDLYTYPKRGITGDLDADFAERLDRADALVKSNPEKSVAIYDGILAETEHMSPRALYGKARAKDQLSEKKKSNALLEEAIQLFSSVLELGEAAPDALFRMAGVRCAERMQFRGWSDKAVAVLAKLISRFPEESQLRNDLGVQYLTIGHNRHAKEVFERELKRNPDNGFAAAHLGFVLKSEGDLAGGAELLGRGIASGQEGAAQGKFYYHLGEALQRLGRKAESDKVCVS